MIHFQVISDYLISLGFKMQKVRFCPWHHITGYPAVWRRELFEVLDLVHSEVTRRFDQEGIRIAAQREQAVINAAQGKDINVQNVALFVPERLELELSMLVDTCKGRSISTLQDVIAIFQQLTPQTRTVLPEAEKLIKLCLAVPTSVAASECSFSSLRRLKTWLRNAVTQERLTYLALMNAHKEILDAINVQSLMREFVSRRSERRSTFGHML